MIERVPVASAEDVQTAVRVLPEPVSATAEQPAMVVAPSRNSTLPVGALPVTVAVRDTDCPATDGFSELAIVVVVGCCDPVFTTCESVALVEGVLPASPA